MKTPPRTALPWTGRRRRTLTVTIAGDLACMTVAWTVAFLVRFGPSPPPFNTVPFLLASPALFGVALAVLNAYGLYSPHPGSWTRVWPSILSGTVVAKVLQAALLFMLRAYALPKTVLVLAAVIEGLALLAWRRAFTRMALGSEGYHFVIACGDGGDAGRSTEIFAGAAAARGAAVSRLALAGDETPPDLAERLEAVLRGVRGQPYLVISAELPRAIRKTLLTAAWRLDVPPWLVPDSLDVLLTGARLAGLEGYPALEVANPALRGRVSRRAADVVFALAGLILAAPVMLLVAIAVRLDSRGPILLRQERSGADGRPFAMLKFRTMVVDAERSTGPVLAGRHDPRVTRVGALLRPLRLDELPQFVNVLLGHMTFIGPRPERPSLSEGYRGEVPDFDLRLSYPAGITGLAQVEGEYHSAPEQKLSYDLYYAARHSWLFNLRIILLTVPRLIADLARSVGRRTRPREGGGHDGE
jgi:exopolysaccharide biosynthesis polyprenyl glycosylphosphotransferase